MIQAQIHPTYTGNLTDMYKLREWLPYTSSVVSAEQKLLGMNGTPHCLWNEVRW